MRVAAVVPPEASVTLVPAEPSLPLLPLVAPEPTVPRVFLPAPSGPPETVIALTASVVPAKAPVTAAVAIVPARPAAALASITLAATVVPAEAPVAIIPAETAFPWLLSLITTKPSSPCVPFAAPPDSAETAVALASITLAASAISAEASVTIIPAEAALPRLLPLITTKPPAMLPAWAGVPAEAAGAVSVAAESSPVVAVVSALVRASLATVSLLAHRKVLSSIRVHCIVPCRAGGRRCCGGCVVCFGYA